MACNYDNIYISLEEASGLENISYNTMVVKIKRNPQSYNIKKRTSCTGW